VLPPLLLAQVVVVVVLLLLLPQPPRHLLLPVAVLLHPLRPLPLLLLEAVRRLLPPAPVLCRLQGR
jgi:hypothetical protein